MKDLPFNSEFYKLNGMTSKRKLYRPLIEDLITYGKVIGLFIAITAMLFIVRLFLIPFS